MGQLLPAADPQLVAAVAGEACRPLAGPADHHDYALAAPLDVVVRPGAVGRAPAIRREALLRPGLECRGERFGEKKKKR